VVECENRAVRRDRHHGRTGRRDNEEWWEYLTRIEEEYEAASAVDLDLLPALMLRSRRPTAPGAPDAVQR